MEVRRQIIYLKRLTVLVNWIQCIEKVPLQSRQTLRYGYNRYSSLIS
jgi:hypothetical protein